MDRPEQLIEAYIKELEAGARDRMVLLSSSKVVRRFKVKSPHLRGQIARLLPKVAERYGYAVTRKGHRKVYIKTLRPRY